MGSMHSISQLCLMVIHKRGIDDDYKTLVQLDGLENGAGACVRDDDVGVSHETMQIGCIVKSREKGHCGCGGREVVVRWWSMSSVLKRNRVDGELV